MNRNQRIRNIVCIVLVALYAIGLVCMFLNAFGVGLALWVASTVGGMAALFHIRNKEEKDAFERGKGDGDDKPCE